MANIFGTDGIRCLVNQEPLSAETSLKIAKTVAYLYWVTLIGAVFLLLVCGYSTSTFLSSG